MDGLVILLGRINTLHECGIAGPTLIEAAIAKMGLHRANRMPSLTVEREYSPKIATKGFTNIGLQGEARAVDTGPIDTGHVNGEGEGTYKGSRRGDGLG